MSQVWISPWLEWDDEKQNCFGPPGLELNNPGLMPTGEEELCFVTCYWSVISNIASVRIVFIFRCNILGVMNSILSYCCCSNLNPYHVSSSSSYDEKTGLKIAVKKLSRPFQSIIHAKRTYRELRLLKHMKHENVSFISLNFLWDGSVPPGQHPVKLQSAKFKIQIS